MTQTVLLNRIYQKVWVYFNFFQPLRKLVAKEIVSNRVKRRFDCSHPPLDRLCETGVLSEDKKQLLLKPIAAKGRDLPAGGGTFFFTQCGA